MVKPLSRASQSFGKMDTYDLSPPPFLRHSGQRLMIDDFTGRSGPKWRDGRGRRGRRRHTSAVVFRGQTEKGAGSRENEAKMEKYDCKSDLHWIWSVYGSTTYVVDGSIIPLQRPVRFFFTFGFLIHKHTNKWRRTRLISVNVNEILVVFDYLMFRKWRYFKGKDRPDGENPKMAKKNAGNF